VVGAKGIVRGDLGVLGGVCDRCRECERCRERERHGARYGLYAWVVVSVDTR